MPQVSTENAERISDEAKDVIRAQDGALLAHQLLFASVLTTARGAALPFSDEQRVYATMHRVTGAMLDARWAFGDGLRELRALARRTGAETVLEGCAAACPVSLGGDVPAAVVAAPASAPPVAAEA